GVPECVCPPRADTVTPSRAVRVLVEPHSRLTIVLDDIDENGIREVDGGDTAKCATDIPAVIVVKAHFASACILGCLRRCGACERGDRGQAERDAGPGQCRGEEAEFSHGGVTSLARWPTC